MHIVPIKGYEGRYEITTDGEIFRFFKNGKKRHLKGYRKNNTYCVKLTDTAGKATEYSYGRLVYESFKGTIPDNYVIKHKNNLVSDNRLINLRIVTMSERGKNTGPSSRSKPVELLNDNGKVIESWTSARKAAKDLFVSYQTVMDICNKKIKKKPLINVRWEKG